MNDETSEVRRVNGFAPGDRVAIVDCELAGAYGKVLYSVGGCHSESCRNLCYLVIVHLMSKPQGVEELPRRTWFSYDDEGEAEDDIKRFKVSEVTHVD